MQKFSVVYADPPWPYTDFGSERASAHMDLMSWSDIRSLDVRSICEKKAALFLWATGPFLDKQIRVMAEWGFHYRGVAQVWVKTRKDGGIIGAQGGVPTFVKSKAEFLLVGTTEKKGRPFPIHDLTIPQVRLHPPLAHSRKPDVFRQMIDKLCGDVAKIELFARHEWPGWAQSGLEFNTLDYRRGDLVGEQHG